MSKWLWDYVEVGKMSFYIERTMPFSPLFFKSQRQVNGFSGPENRYSNIYSKLKVVFRASAIICHLKPFRVGPFHFCNAQDLEWSISHKICSVYQMNLKGIYFYALNVSKPGQGRCNSPPSSAFGIQKTEGESEQLALKKKKKSPISLVRPGSK